MRIVLAVRRSGQHVTQTVNDTAPPRPADLDAKYSSGLLEPLGNQRHFFGGARSLCGSVPSGTVAPRRQISAFQFAAYPDVFGSAARR